MFFAAINQQTFRINEEIIIWNTAPINPGGHYDTLTGAYTAPVHGYYQFTVQKESDNSANFRIYKEGVWVLYNDGIDGSVLTPVSTSSFILELQAGERVQIYNSVSCTMYGGTSGVYRSWFSGFLLYSA